VPNTNPNNGAQIMTHTCDSCKSQITDTLDACVTFDYQINCRECYCPTMDAEDRDYFEDRQGVYTPTQAEKDRANALWQAQDRQLADEILADDDLW
jgi:hypothetical protein